MDFQFYWIDRKLHSCCSNTTITQVHNHLSDRSFGSVDVCVHARWRCGTAAGLKHYIDPVFPLSRVRSWGMHKLPCSSQHFQWRSTWYQDVFLSQRIKVKSSQAACSKSILNQQLWGADAERTLSKSGAGAERVAEGKGVQDGGQGNKTRRPSDSP